MAKDKDDAPKPKNPFKKLRKLMRDAPIAMLTTVAADGSLRSRPMATPDGDFDGELWFFTRYHSPKSEEIQENQKVNVTYASPKNDRYVSVSGRAALVRDAEKVKQLWRGALKRWFPDGKKDPELALLRVTVDRAEYWDADENRMVDLPPMTGPDKEREVEKRGSGRRPDPVEAPTQGGAMG
jgi:general stress protein 26